MGKKMISLLLSGTFMLSLFITSGLANSQEDLGQEMVIDKQGVFTKEAKGNPYLSDEEKKKRRVWIEETVSKMVKEKKTRMEIDAF